ncbi:DUF3592 domain-containing protein [Alphaproteobacteria bacterium]|nr:DUF3592 domain-containing protein [Alphaproteobacteria bacterium]
MKAAKFISYTFTLVGFASIIAGFIWYQVTQGFLNEATITEGEVVELRGSRSSDGSSSYSPVVRFKDGTGTEHQFTSSFSSGRSSFTPGEWVQVAYDDADPTKAQIKEFLPLWLGPIIFWFVGSIFFSIGLGFTIVPYLKERKRNNLRQVGRPIPARITDVSINQSYRVNGRRPYVIHAQWFDPKTASVRLFRSDNFWYDPEPYINQEEVTVFIDKNINSRYWMDTSFLSK